MHANGGRLPAIIAGMFLLSFSVLVAEHSSFLYAADLIGAAVGAVVFF